MSDRCSSYHLDSFCARYSVNIGQTILACWRDINIFNLTYIILFYGTLLKNKMNTVILLRILTIIPFVCTFYFPVLVLLVCNCVSLVTRAASSSSAARYNQHCTTQNVSFRCMLTRLMMVAAACQNNIVMSPAKP